MLCSDLECERIWYIIFLTRPAVGVVADCKTVIWKKSG
jgi:hypothetical protein